MTHTTDGVRTPPSKLALWFDKVPEPFTCAWWADRIKQQADLLCLP
jgi:hypothetical protein